MREGGKSQDSELISFRSLRFHFICCIIDKDGNYRRYKLDEIGANSVGIGSES